MFGKNSVWLTLKETGAIFSRPGFIKYKQQLSRLRNTAASGFPAFQERRSQASDTAHQAQNHSNLRRGKTVMPPHVNDH
jgi:hypothetical protein